MRRDALSSERAPFGQNDRRNLASNRVLTRIKAHTVRKAALRPQRIVEAALMQGAGLFLKLAAGIPAVILALAAPAVAASARSAGCTLAITHVNVIPMDIERVLGNRTVLISGRRILTITPAVRAPRCTRVIDGMHRYLVPGLNDLH